MPSNRQWLPEGFSFLSGYPTEQRKRKVLMPIQVMVDESGFKGQSLVFCMAGLIGHAEAWAVFADEWKAFLRQEPAIDYFKMQEAAGLTGQFHGFTEAERDAKLRGLAATINRGKFVLIEIGVANYLTIQLTVPGIKKPLKLSPYWQGYQFMIGGAALTMWDAGFREKFEIFFDENAVQTPRAKKWYPIVKKIVPEHLLAVMPAEPFARDDKDFVALQAPDLFAWLRMQQWRMLVREIEAGVEPDPNAVPFRWILDEMPDVRISVHSRVFYKGIDPKAASSPEESAKFLGAIHEVFRPSVSVAVSQQKRPWWKRLRKAAVRFFRRITFRRQ